jgi:uncharacterized protein (TIGR02265 family)
MAYAARVSRREELFAEVARHCDVHERLTFMPPSAKSRGLYFRSIESVLTRAGGGRVEAYHAMFPERFTAIPWYPTADFLKRLVVGAALLTSPERVHEGMFEIGRRNAVAFAESLIGRTMLRLLSRDPQKLMQQSVAGRRQSSGYGQWSLALPEPRTAVMTMVEEYVYIESYLLGAAQGTFDAIAVPVRTEVVLENRFVGKHILKW